MARYTEDAGINQPFDVVSMVMEDYIYHNRFSRGDWEGEPVYLCTDAHGKTRYLKWNYASGILHLEAWLKNPFGNEMNLTGISAGRSGKEYKESIDRLIQNLRSHSGAVQSAYIGQDPLHHPQPSGGRQPAYPAQFPGGRQPVRPMQPAGGQYSARPQQAAGGQYPTAGPQSGQAGQMPQTANRQQAAGMPRQGQGYVYGRPVNTSLGIVMGIFALISAFGVPLLGIIFSTIGLNKCRTDGVMPDSVKKVRNLCMAALIISVVMLVLSILINFVFYDIMLLCINCK